MAKRQGGDVGIRHTLSIKQSWVPRKPSPHGCQAPDIPSVHPAPRASYCAVSVSARGGGVRQCKQASNQANRTDRPSTTQQHPEADISFSPLSRISPLRLPYLCQGPTSTLLTPRLISAGWGCAREWCGGRLACLGIRAAADRGVRPRKIGGADGAARGVI